MNALRYLGYFFRRAAENVGENPFLNLVAVGMIAVSIFLFSSFLLVATDLNALFERWGRGIRVTAYLEGGLDATRRDALERKLRNRPEVQELCFIGKPQALARLKEMLKGSQALLDDLNRRNPLPESFEIDLKTEFRQDEKIRAFVRWLSEQKNLSEVLYGQEWVERFAATLHFVQLVGIFFGGIFVLAALFIISNTIRVILFARRDELQIMKSVGATDSFITLPFVLEGSLQGLVGAGMALGSLYAFHSLALVRLSQVFLLPTFPFLSRHLVIGILAGSMVLGALGSLISAMKFLRE